MEGDLVPGTPYLPRLYYGSDHVFGCGVCDEGELQTDYLDQIEKKLMLIKNQFNFSDLFRGT